MTFVVKRRHGYELRTSRVTDDGPRATTLATFRVLDDGVLRRAEVRAARPLEAAEIRRRARAAGAPVAPPDVVLAARTLLVELDGGRRPPAALAARLAEALQGADGVGGAGVGDALGDALPWVGASDDDRGAALVDLLALTDRLPARAKNELRFPGVHHDGR